MRDIPAVDRSGPAAPERRPGTRLRRLCGALPGLLMALSCLVHSGPAGIDPATLEAVAARHGQLARERLEAWRRVVDSAAHLPVEAKLETVNDFFNDLAFVSDLTQWGVQDYWATPSELLARGGGDCEDFSIAKYFTLLELGVPEARLQLSYVKALRLNQAHMVLTYYAHPRAEPLVLDNLNFRVLPASQRTDLLPVYSFNGSGLWLAKERRSGQRVGSSARLGRWRDLLARMGTTAR